MKYRHKPMVIEAVQWFEGPTIEAVHLLSHEPDPRVEARYWPHVHTIHAGHSVSIQPGDWIISESDGVHFYPCRPDIFEATYELVE